MNSHDSIAAPGIFDRVLWSFHDFPWFPQFLKWVQLVQNSSADVKAEPRKTLRRRNGISSMAAVDNTLHKLRYTPQNYGYIWSTIYRLITGTPLPIWGSTLGRPWDEVTLLVDQFRSVWWAKQWILNETLKMVVNQRIKGSTHIYQNLFFCAHQEQVVNGCSTELEKPKSCYRWGLNRAQILFSAPVRIVKGLPQPDRCSVDE